jgi:hypothetical protein
MGSLAALSVACTDPIPGFSSSTPSSSGGANGQAEAPEDCPAQAAWLPSDGSQTPPVAMFSPAKHPNTECPFYSGGWQSFLIATHPDATGLPDFASYATVDDLFQKKTPLAAGALAPVGQPRGTPLRAWLGDIKQAGNRNVLIDQDAHSLYYGIHVNQAFVDFVNANKLTTAAQIQGASQALYFPAGVAEFKTAWKDIDPADGVTGDWSNYITTTAWVATIHQDATSGAITEDKDHPRQIKVALVAMHVVFTLPGHPEFVWTSFQHIDTTGVDINTEAPGLPDSAPVFQTLPSTKDPNNLMDSQVVDTKNYLLYHGGTAANEANPAFVDKQLTLDEASQKFTGANAQTSIYRMYAGSKSNSINPDDAVTAINSNMLKLFDQAAPQDLRRNYKLVGGTWMDKPEFFALGKSLQSYDPDSNPLFGLSTVADETQYANITQDDERTALLAQGVKPVDDYAANGADSPFSLLAGEDRMSSTSMESFTQGAASFFNCFRCHNTQAVTQRGISLTDDDPTASPLMPEKLINVSHVFGEFILEECGPQGMCQ